MSLRKPQNPGRITVNLFFERFGAEHLGHALACSVMVRRVPEDFLPMTESREAHRRARARSRILPLALSATSAAGLMLAFVWHDAARLGPPATSQAVRLVQDELQKLGYDWARVTVSGRTVHLMGRAPSDSARVMAFDTTKRALRPLMGKDAVIDGIESHLGLSAAAIDPAKSRTNRISSGPGLDIATLLPPPTPLIHTPAATPSLQVTSDLGSHAEPAVPPHEEAAERGDAASPRETSAEEGATALAPKDESLQAGVSATADVYMPAAADEPAAVEAASVAATTPATNSETAHEAPPAEAVIETSALDTAHAPQIKSADACAQSFDLALSGKTIGFARDSEAIEKESRPLLDKLASIAKRCKAYRFTVEGHTDLTGTRVHNLDLSRRRAAAVRWALIDRGVDMDHITSEGYGASRPLEQGTSDAANARNRRIVISVVEPVTKPAAKSANNR